VGKSPDENVPLLVNVAPAPTFPPPLKHGLENGAKLRVDTTVVETDIHYPTDSTLLWDVVRVLTRLVGRLAKR
jgi:hypothetical protein